MRQQEIRIQAQWPGLRFNLNSPGLRELIDWWEKPGVKMQNRGSQGWDGRQGLGHTWPEKKSQLLEDIGENWISIMGDLRQSHGRRQWHLTPVLLPGKSHGRRSLVGCSPWVAKSRTWLSDFTFMHWRRKWQLTPVFLPGESQGRGSLVGCRLWGCTGSDTTEAT